MHASQGLFPSLLGEGDASRAGKAPAMKSQQQIEEDLRGNEDFQTAYKGMNRPCTLLTPASESRGRSWFGKVELGAPGESWPTHDDQPMQPFLQLDLESMANPPESCSDLALITIFLYPEPLGWTRNNGDGWCLRAYPKGQELVPLVAPTTENPFQAQPLQTKAADDFPVGPMGEPEIIEDDELMTALDSLEDTLCDLEEEHDETPSFRQLFPNQQALKIGGWPSWLYIASEWPDEPTAPRYVLQVPNLSSAGWEQGEISFIYFARGETDPDAWVLDFQIHKPMSQQNQMRGLLPLNLYHTSLVGSEPRESRAVCQEDEQEEEATRYEFCFELPCGCGNLHYSVTEGETGVSCGHYISEQGTPVSQAVLPLAEPDNLVQDARRSKCHHCGRFWELELEPAEPGTFRLTMRAGFAELRQLLEQVQADLDAGNADKAWQSWKRVNEFRIPAGAPIAQACATQGVKCALALGKPTLALEIGGKEERAGILSDLPGRAGTELQKRLDADPQHKALFERFLSATSTPATRTGGTHLELDWVANLEEPALKLTVSGRVEDEGIVYESLEAAPPNLGFALSQLAFEDGAGEKAKGYFLAGRSCLESGLKEHALVLFETARGYFPDSKMINDELAKLQAEGVQRSDWTRRLQEQCQ